MPIRFHVLLLLVGMLLAPSSMAQPAGESAVAATWMTTLPVAQTAQHFAPALTDDYRLDSYMHHFWMEGSWVPAVQVENTFTGTDRTARTSYFWTGFAWLEDDRTLMTYADGRMISEVTQLWDGAAWADVERTTYTYTGDQLTMMTVELWAATSWTNDERIRFTYNEEGLVIGSYTEVWQGINWEPAEQTTFIEGDLVVVQIDETWDGSNWVNELRTTYGLMTLQGLINLFDEFNDELLNEVGFFLGLALPAYTQETWDGAAWVNTDRLITEDILEAGTNRLVGRNYINETWDGAEWERSFRQRVAFDAEGREESTAFDEFDGVTWQLAMEELYTYDDRGVLVEALQTVPVETGSMNVARLLMAWSKITSVEGEVPPGHYVLEPAYPNPFNPQTTLTYTLQATGPVALRVYDTLGRQVATLFEGTQAAGTHTAIFDAAPLPSGLYLVRLEAPGATQTRMVTLIK